MEIIGAALPLASDGAIAAAFITAKTKFCSMTYPDLDRDYAIEKRGEKYFNSDEEIPASQLPEVLAQYIKNLQGDGAEWGWEFKF